MDVLRLFYGRQKCHRRRVSVKVYDEFVSTRKLYCNLKSYIIVNQIYKVHISSSLGKPQQEEGILQLVLNKRHIEEFEIKSENYFNIKEDCNGKQSGNTIKI